MALVTIATVAIVLGSVVVRRVNWYRRSGWPSQANDTAAIFTASVGEHDGSADDIVFASKVLHERRHGVVVSIRSAANVVSIQRAWILSRAIHVWILQRVEHRTHVCTHRVKMLNVSVLVDCEIDDIICGATGEIDCALDLYWVA